MRAAEPSIRNSLNSPRINEQRRAGRHRAFQCSGPSAGLRPDGRWACLRPDAGNTPRRTQSGPVYLEGADSGRAAKAWRECEKRRAQRAAFHRERFGGGGRTALGALLLKAWARTLAIAISLLLGISISSWGLTQWLSFRVRTLVRLEARIKAQQRALELLEGKTWGLDLHEASNGKYVVLPKGTRVLDHIDRPAIKLVPP